MKSIRLFLESTSPPHHLFIKILNVYKKEYSWDLFHIKLKITKYGRYNDGKICYDMKPGEFGGSWTDKNIIYLNQDMESVKKFYKVTTSIQDLTTIIISHELAHEVYRNILNNIEKKTWVNRIKKTNFKSTYLNHVSKKKYDEELFCEYIAHQILNKIKDY